MTDGQPLAEHEPPGRFLVLSRSQGRPIMRLEIETRDAGAAMQIWESLSDIRISELLEQIQFQ